MRSSTVLLQWHGHLSNLSLDVDAIVAAKALSGARRRNQYAVDLSSHALLPLLAAMPNPAQADGQCFNQTPLMAVKDIVCMSAIES
jgi:hypothetical protein